MKIEEIITDSKRLFLGADVPEDYVVNPYAQDTPSIYGVALPISHDEVVQLVEFAKEENLTIIARGAGTGVPAHNIRYMAMS